MTVWKDDDMKEKEGGNEILYGTQTGRMGLVKFTEDEPNYCWDMLNERRSLTSHTH